MTATPGVDMTTADDTYGSVGVHGIQASPPLVSLGRLSDDDSSLVQAAVADIGGKRHRLQIRDAYFRGVHQIVDLGISIPPQMRSLRIPLGWPRVAVESIDERLNLEGFRYPAATDVDEDLQGLLLANGLDSDAHLVHLDALVFGQGFVCVGAADNEGDVPLASIESPLDMSTKWDARARLMTSAVRVYGPATELRATLYLPDRTVWARRSQGGGWVVDDADEHGLGIVPVVRFANRARSYQREGESEITPELMALTDESCRTAQALAVAREFYSGPQRYILGARESDFVDAEGKPKSAWDTYLGRVLALEADEDGHTPSVGQFQAYDPSVFTRVIEMYARVASAVTGLPPHILGYAADNPTSADAIIKGEMRLKLKADRKTRVFGPSWAQVARLLLLLRDGSLPPQAESITAVWGDTGTPTPSATTDAVAKQITAGSVPATSDVTLERLGYSAVERQRLAQDRDAAQSDAMLRDIASALTKPAGVVAQQ